MKGDGEMAIEIVPDWMTNLEDEDIELKEIANQYGVTYPTVRLRLDRLIQKIRLNEDTQSDPYISLIKRLAINEKLDFDTAKLLIQEYRKGGEMQ